MKGFPFISSILVQPKRIAHSAWWFVHHCNLRKKKSRLVYRADSQIALALRNNEDGVRISSGPTGHE